MVLQEHPALLTTTWRLTMNVADAQAAGIYFGPIGSISRARVKEMIREGGARGRIKVASNLYGALADFALQGKRSLGRRVALLPVLLATLIRLVWHTSLFRLRVHPRNMSVGEADVYASILGQFRCRESARNVLGQALAGKEAEDSQAHLVARLKLARLCYDEQMYDAAGNHYAIAYGHHQTNPPASWLQWVRIERDFGEWMLRESKRMESSSLRQKGIEHLLLAWRMASRHGVNSQISKLKEVALEHRVHLIV